MDTPYLKKWNVLEDEISSVPEIIAEELAQSDGERGDII